MNKMVLEYNVEPYEMGDPNSKTGCLLFHGYTGSPIDMFPIAKICEKYDWHIKVPRLPGHGIPIDHLIKTKHTEWLIAAEKEYVAFAKNKERIILGGHSLGNVLIFHLDVKYRKENKISNLLSISPPVIIKKRWMLPFIDIAKIFVRKIDYSVIAFKDKRIMKHPLYNYLRSTYKEYPLGIIKELVKAVNYGIKLIPLLRTDVLVMFGKEDDVVDPKSGYEILIKAKSKHKALVMFEGMHVPMLDIDYKEFQKVLISYFNEISNKKLNVEDNTFDIFNLFDEVAKKTNIDLAKSKLHLLSQ